MTPPADDLVRPALERIVSRLDSSGNYSSGASADVKIILAAIVSRDQRIAALEGEVARWRQHCFQADQNAGIQVDRAEAAEARAAAAEGDARRYRIISAGEDFIVYAIDTGDDGTGIKEVEIPSDQLDAAADEAIAAGEGK